MRYILVTFALLAIAAVSVSLGLFQAEELTLTDVSAMRITQHTAKRLTVHRIIIDGEATDLAVPSADPQPALSVVRFDLKLNGKHLTVWARDD